MQALYLFQTNETLIGLTLTWTVVVSDNVFVQSTGSDDQLTL